MPENRKLATILALDVAGYSRAAEADDSAAADAVRKLRAAITQIADPLSGRLFNSAGDGFMLEFPTATAGLQAAVALLNECRSSGGTLPQVRMGLHLGEVIVEPDGDLLGHGVNIAARLQQMSAPGGLIVSEDIKRSVRGSLANSLRPMGEVTLNKMHETLSVYALGPSASLGSQQWIRSQRGKATMLAIAIAIAASVGVAVIALWPVRAARTAVFTFATQEPLTQNLAEGLATEIIATMSEMGLEPISRNETSQPGQSNGERADALRAAFALDGEILRDGDAVRVSARLEDTSARQTIWARTFERESSRLAELRLEVAAEAVNVLQCAAQARAERPRLAPATMAMLLRSCELANTSGREIELVRLAQLVSVAAPRSSLAQGRLAFVTARASQTVAAPMREQMREDALAAANRALRLDRRNGAAAAVKVWALSFTQTLSENDQTFVDLLRTAPDSAELNGLYARLLRSTGRNEEAVAYYQRALAREPLSPLRAGNLAWGLAIVGRNEEAQALLNRMDARWPDADDIWWARFRTAVWFGSREEALHVLSENSSWGTSSPACWRRAIDAMAATNSGSRRASALAIRGCLEPDSAMQFLGSLGENDAAFELAEIVLETQGERAFSGMFFVPATDALRRDARFMPLMDRFGLIDYWRATGRWPDFCAEPDLPYNCRTEANRIAANDVERH